jgi:hypothetical protein
MSEREHHEKNHNPQVCVLLYDREGKPSGKLWYCPECQKEQGLEPPDIEALGGKIQKGLYDF